LKGQLLLLKCKMATSTALIINLTGNQDPIICDLFCMFILMFYHVYAFSAGQAPLQGRKIFPSGRYLLYHHYAQPCVIDIEKAEVEISDDFDFLDTFPSLQPRDQYLKFTRHFLLLLDTLLSFYSVSYVILWLKKIE
jgi:hypothetical protein